MHTRIHTHMHTRTCIHTHIHTLICIHTYTAPHTQIERKNHRIITYKHASHGKCPFFSHSLLFCQSGKEEVREPSLHYTFKDPPLLNFPKFDDFTIPQVQHIPHALSLSLSLCFSLSPTHAHSRTSDHLTTLVHPLTTLCTHYSVSTVGNTPSQMC